MEDDDRHGWYLLLAHSNGHHTVGETRPMPSGANWTQPCQPQTLPGLPVTLTHSRSWGNPLKPYCYANWTWYSVKTSQQLIHPHWPIIFSLTLCCPLVDVSCRHIFRSIESFRQHHFRQLVWPRPRPVFFMCGPYTYPVLKLFLILWRQCSFLWICQQLLLCKFFHQSPILQYGQYRPHPAILYMFSFHNEYSLVVENKWIRHKIHKLFIKAWKFEEMPL